MYTIGDIILLLYWGYTLAHILPGPIPYMPSKVMGYASKYRQKMAGFETAPKPKKKGVKKKGEGLTASKQCNAVSLPFAPSI